MTTYQRGGVCSRTTADSNYVRYERTDGEPISVATAIAIASFRQEEPTAGSTQLYDYIDPEALDSLFADRQNGMSRCPGRVMFDLPDATVRIEQDAVTVTPRGESAAHPEP